MGYNIIVCIKQIANDIEIDPQTREPVFSDTKYRLEDLSRNAVEEAVRIKEKYGGKVTGILFGTEQSTVVMKEAMAMGADEGIIVKGFKENSPDFTAKVLAERIKRIQYDIIIIGYASADSYTAQVPGALSILLGIPLLGSAIKTEIADNKVRITRESDDFDIVESASMPLLVSVTQEANEPRLPLLIQVMAAAKKPMSIEETALKYDGIDKIIGNKAPESGRKHIIYEDEGKGIEEIVKIIKGEIS